MLPPCLARCFAIDALRFTALAASLPLSVGLAQAQQTRAPAASGVTLDEIGVQGDGRASGGAGAAGGVETLRESPRGPVRGYVATTSATATKTDTPLIRTPQSISVVGTEQIRAQNAADRVGGRALHARHLRQPVRPGPARRLVPDPRVLGHRGRAVPRRAAALPDGFRQLQGRRLRRGAHRGPAWPLRHAVRRQPGGRPRQHRLEAPAPRSTAVHRGRRRIVQPDLHRLRRWRPGRSLGTLVLPGHRPAAEVGRAGRPGGGGPLLHRTEPDL